jgi:hypothetical protein
MSGPDSSKRILERALENVGDEEKLAELLGADTAELSRWMLGTQLPPNGVFLRALDLAFQGTTPLASPRIGAGSFSPRKV